MKGVYYALVLTHRNFATFKCKSKTKQRECPVGMLYTYHAMLYSPWCTCTPLVGIYVAVVLCTYRRGAFCVARFDLQGNAKASMCGASIVQGFTLFLCLQLTDVSFCGVL